MYSCFGVGAQLVTNPVNSNDSCVSVTQCAISVRSAQENEWSRGKKSIAGVSFVKSHRTGSPFVTTKDVTQLLHTYCLCLGHRFINEDI